MWEVVLARKDFPEGVKLVLSIGGLGQESLHLLKPQFFVKWDNSSTYVLGYL